MYVAKCFNKPYIEKPIGSKAKKWEKCLIGFSLTMLVIMLIAGPLLLFRNLAPLSTTINTVSADLEFLLKIHNSTLDADFSIDLFKTTQTVSNTIMTQA